MLSIETSAKAGHNVKSLFKKIAVALPGGEPKHGVAEGTDANASELPPFTLPNTQQSLGRSLIFVSPLCSSLCAFRARSEIDVSAAKQADVPDAGGCAC